jgi:hypothetical protein
MLRRDALLAAAKARTRAPFLKGIQNVLHVVVSSPFRIQKTGLSAF